MFYKHRLDFYAAFSVQSSKSKKKKIKKIVLHFYPHMQKLKSENKTFIVNLVQGKLEQSSKNMDF